MATLNPYIIFDGNTEQAFNFYKSVFGGEFLMLARYKDMPQDDNITPSDKDKIAHVTLDMGKGNVLMGSDIPESIRQGLKVGNNIHISINAESKEEAKKLFDGLSAGGSIEMPLQDVSWGAYYAMFTDKFEITWMVNYQYEKSS